MDREQAISLQQKEKENRIVTNRATILSDLKELFKGIVLISNVLPVFAGLWLALYLTDASISAHWDTLLLILVGSALVMSGALILNNWYDVDMDKVMDRTKNRPTVTGHFSLKSVLTMGVVFSVLGFILLLFTTIEATLYAFIGWFVYVILYTMWSKRKYTLNTVIGSISGAVTPLIGWAAITPVNHIAPIGLFLFLFIWQVPHTFVIAIRKYDEYKAAEVPMLPVVYGFAMTKRQTIIYIACLLPLPFLLATLGTTFVIIATLMSLGWLILGISGFFTKDDWKWANRMFLYSVNFLLFFFLLVIAVATP